MHDKSRVIILTSKSSFLPKESEMKILRGYCGGDSPTTGKILLWESVLTN